MMRKLVLTDDNLLRQIYDDIESGPGSAFISAKTYINFKGGKSNAQKDEIS